MVWYGLQAKPPAEGAYSLLPDLGAWLAPLASQPLSRGVLGQQTSKVWCTNRGAPQKGFPLESGPRKKALCVLSII